MNCICCGSTALTERAEVTARGYRRFRCRLRYRLTLRDLSEIMAPRGIEVSHKAVRDWKAKRVPLLA